MIIGSVQNYNQHDGNGKGDVAGQGVPDYGSEAAPRWREGRESRAR